MRYTLLVVATLIFPPAILLSETIHVPADYPKIQEAVDAAQAGDTVLVAPGSYLENIDFKGKAVIVAAEGGPELTVVDGCQKGSVVTFKNGEGPDSVLRGFTLTNGSGTEDPGFGGSAKCGGGIYCRDSSPSIVRNIIRGNKVLKASNGYFARGGGVFVRNGSPAIEGCIVEENLSENGSGGIHLTQASGILANNLVLNNEAFSAGGVGCYDNAAPLFVNCTFAGNQSTWAGGFLSADFAKPLIRNTILWNNQAGPGPEIMVGEPCGLPAELDIGHSDVKGGMGSVYVNYGCTLNWGCGMIDGDPLFVDSVDGDFHISCDSPCKDAGDGSIPGLPESDFEGDPRIAYDAADMGADEFHTHLYYTGDATPGGRVELKLVGLPGASPVGLCIGSGVLDPPIPSMWGEWYLQFPIAGPVDLGILPSPGGIMIIPGTLPMNPPAPYALPMQALVDDLLTNLLCMQIQ